MSKNLTAEAAGHAEWKAERINSVRKCFNSVFLSACPAASAVNPLREGRR
jgi:hypothetical protein